MLARAGLTVVRDGRTPWTRYGRRDPRYWLVYLRADPRDAAYVLPRALACALFNRHSAVCAGLRDPKHMKWRAANIARRGRRSGRR